MIEIARLHYITQDLPHTSHTEQIRMACDGGVKWVQLRVKGKDYQEWLPIARDTQAVCREYNAIFIINDNVQIAKELGADGIHLGKTDMSPTEARTILGPNAIIGGTANSLEDVKHLLTQPVDYIGLGPYRFTTTKEKLAPVLGLEGIKLIINELLNDKTTKPIITIGGITINDIDALMESGIYGIAVSSAINLAENPTFVASNLVAKFASH